MVNEHDGDLSSLDATLTREWLIATLLGVLRSARATVQNIREIPNAWCEPASPHHTVTDQAVSETAVLLLVATRIPNLPASVHEVAVEIAAQLLPLARSDRQRDLLMRRPERTAYAGITHIVLEHLGFPDAIFDELIHTAFEHGYIRSLEKLPFRTMDERWVEGLLFPDRQVPSNDLAALSILGGRAHPIHMDPVEIYALTHAVMYLTDFGMRSLPATFPTREVEAKADACIASVLLSNNLDLLAELVICSVALAAKPSPHVRLAWAVLRTTWEGIHVLPSPSYDAVAHSSFSAEANPGYFHRHTYHTTFVFGILSAILLSRFDEGAFTRGSGNNLAGCGDSTPSNTAWTPERLAHRFRRAASRARSFSGPEQGSVQATRAAPPLPPQGDAAHYELLRYLQGRVDTVRAMAMQPSTIAAARLSPCELALTQSDALLIKSCRDYDLGVTLDILLMIVPLFRPLSASAREAIHFLLRQLDGMATGGGNCGTADTCHHTSTEKILSAPDRLDLMASLLEPLG